MLSASSRLRRSTDFAATVKQGRRARRGTVVVHLARRNDGTGARAGFIVSKAVGGAVVRNHVKRRLRHVTAARIHEWGRDIDVVVRALPQSAKADFDKLARDVDEALAAAERRRR